MDAPGVPPVVRSRRGTIWIYRSFPACGRRRSAAWASNPDGSVQPVNITIPELSLVALIGPSGCGKSTFARAHFKSTEVVSSDFCRGLVSDDENDQSATKEAFEILHYIVRKRLAAGRLTVIDATNVQME